MGLAVSKIRRRQKNLFGMLRVIGHGSSPRNRSGSSILLDLIAVPNCDSSVESQCLICGLKIRDRT